MGTGLNIGGAFGMGVDSLDDSDGSDGFEDNRSYDLSFNVRSSQCFQGDGIGECKRRPVFMRSGPSVGDGRGSDGWGFGLLERACISA